MSDSKRATATKSLYHEIDLERFEPREGATRIRDMGCDNWENSVSVILSPQRDCQHSELVHEVVAPLEARLGALEWSAWSHRDLPAHPHVHLIIRDPRSDPSSQRQFDALEARIQDAAVRAYGAIRKRQREYARTRDQGRGHER